MLVTLPLMLCIVMIELATGSFILLYVLDTRNAVKRGFLITYAIIYLFLTGLTLLFQQSFSNTVLLNSFTHTDQHWTQALGILLFLFLASMLPYIATLLFDRQAGYVGNGQNKSVWTTMRRILGGVSAGLGIATLFDLGMVYHPLASTIIGQVTIIMGFFAAAIVIGGVMTAMWLGHWYLVTPALSEKPLVLATTVVLIGLALQMLLGSIPFTNEGIGITNALTFASSTHQTMQQNIAMTPQQIHSITVKPASHVAVAAPLSMTIFLWLRILVGLLIPLVLGILTWKLARERSFQSATGMLYLIVVCTLAGEGIARGLFLMGAG